MQKTTLLTIKQVSTAHSRKGYNQGKQGVGSQVDSLEFFNTAATMCCAKKGEVPIPRRRLPPESTTYPQELNNNFNVEKSLKCV